MTVSSRFLAHAAWCAAAVVVLASPAGAQVSTGRIDIAVADASGMPIGGATAHITGPDDQTQTADAGGALHFLDLPVGTYAVHLTHAGFAPYTSNRVEVASGAGTALAVRMTAAGTSETIDGAPATSDTDVRRNTTTVRIGVTELQGVPYTRNPWAVLATVPTLYLDRLDVGGSESAQQAGFVAKGAARTDNGWTLDGVPIHDMGDVPSRPELADGASPFYYDFDTLQEVAVTTGGADVRNATAGAQVNIVLRKGTDQPHGSTRYFLADQRLQSVNISPDLAAALGDTTGKGNRIDTANDYGFDLGGPLLQDQAWVWGALGRSSLNLFTLNGIADDSSFATTAFKADGRLNESVRGNFAYYKNEKTEDGRGAGPLRPIETTWSQSGPSTFYKGGGNFSPGKGLFASVTGAYVGAGFSLVPSGGLAKDYYIDAGGVAHNSYFQYQTTRPQHYYGGEASYFAGANQVTVGGSWRHTAADTQQTWPASHLVATWTDYPAMLVQVTRDYHATTTADDITVYAADTLSLDRITVTGGVRFDRQSSSLGAASVPAVAGFETLLPAVSSTPASDAFRWTTLAPRLAVSGALDGSRKTVARASYALLASQLPGTIAATVSPIQYASAYYNAVDRNGDGVAQLSEILIAQGLQGATGFDPRNPTRTTSINSVAPGLKAPTTQEFVGAVDRELGSSVAVSATFTYRRMADLLWTPLAGVSRASYSLATTVSGTAPELGSYSAPVYALSPAALPPGGGTVTANRPGYHQAYRGLELSLVKRMSNRWMARAAFSTNSWREYFDDPSTAILDPTRAPAPTASMPFAGPQVNGGSVLVPSSGSGRSDVYMVAPAFQLAANGAYDAFWGIVFGANLVSRQGYAEPFFYSSVATTDPLGPKSVLLVSNVDDFRLPAVTTLDARVAKTFTFGPSKVELDFDVFNLLNSATVLGRQFDARLTGATGFGQTLEIMNPRIARLGVRFNF